jgi:hypothetical protein
VIFNAILSFRHPVIITYLKRLIDSIIGGIFIENKINCRKWDAQIWRGIAPPPESI